MRTGLGALVSPIVSTQFSHMSGRRWAFHYLVSAGVALINLVILLVVFRLKTQDQIHEETGVVIRNQDQVDARKTDEETETREESHFKQILRIKSVYILAIFLLCYVGVEVSLASEYLKLPIPWI